MDYPYSLPRACAQCNSILTDVEMSCPRCGTPVPTPKSTYSSPIRPKEVDIAVKVYKVYIVIFGIVAFLFTNIKKLPPHISPIVFLIMLFIILGAFSYFIHMTWKGHNWARIVLLIIFIVSLPFGLKVILHYISIMPLFSLIELVKIALPAIAIILLFRKTSSEWFQEIKKEKTKSQ